MAVHFIPSFLAQIDIQGPTSPEESLGETLNPSGIPSAEPARGKAVSEQVGEQLGFIWPFRHTHCTHIPHTGWLSLQKLEHSMSL